MFLILSVFAFLFFSRASLAKADVAFSGDNIFYFTYDKKPYQKAVHFELNCYGYSFSPSEFEEKAPGTYTPEKVYSWVDLCSEYGCKVSKAHYLNYRHIDYCTLELSSEDGVFQFNIYGFPADYCGFEAAREKCTFNFEIPLKEKKESALISSPASIPTENPTPSPAKTFGVKDIFERIICFIKSIFGKPC